MNKKRTILVIILIIGVILSISGLFVISLNSNNNESSNNHDTNNNLNSRPEPEIESEVMDYDSAYNFASSLYSEEGKIVELKEEDDKFIIYVKNTTGDILNTFNMDKKTGIISEEAIISSSSVSN